MSIRPLTAIETLKAATEMTADRIEKLEAQLAKTEHKAKVYDALCEVGLIQYGEDSEIRCYSVWGFTRWHHDPDIFKAIAACDNQPEKENE
jgi:hypothetical protein